MIPTIGVTEIAAKLTASDIPFALGGSGLLHALGLTDVVHDWDLMTDAPYDAVSACLREFQITRRPKEAPYVSEYVLQLPRENVEVIGSFRLRTERGVVHIPCIATGWWNGISLASPEVWFVAYKLMSRDAQADLLMDYLGRTQIHREAVNAILREPLPPDVRSTAESVFGRDR